MCPLTSRRHQNITFLPGAVRTHRVLHTFRCDRLWIMWPLTLLLNKIYAKHDACAQRRADFNGGRCRCKQRAHGLYENDLVFESRYTLKGRYNIGHVGKTASMSTVCLFSLNQDIHWREGTTLVMLAKLLLWVCLLSLNQDIHWRGTPPKKIKIKIK